MQSSALNAGFDLPQPAQVIERIEESKTVFTLRLRLCDETARQDYSFEPGQFNMVYLYGVGEVPISIVSDISDSRVLDHTIRKVGRVTEGLGNLNVGDQVGIRGPFGRGWPMQQAENKNLVVVTGGLGCAPAVSVIRHVLKRRKQYRHLTIMQGVKHSDDLIWRDQYSAWSKQPDTEVFLAADTASPGWNGQTGLVTSLFDQANLDPQNSIVMICGPEAMMIASAKDLLKRKFHEDAIWVSMERNMQCAVGHCGHCQIGANFVCRNGPVFRYPELQSLLGIKGY